MKRLMLIIGFAIGYVAGSAAGRERYEQIRSMSLKVKNSPQVHGAAVATADAVKEAAPVVKDKVVDAADAAAQKVKSGSNGSDTSPTLEDSAYPRA